MAIWNLLELCLSHYKMGWKFHVVFRLLKIFLSSNYFPLIRLRVIHLTESRWPNDYDRNRWIWLNSWQRQTLTFEHDRKCNRVFGHIHPFMFVVLVIFIIFPIFWSNSAIFRSYSPVYVRCCEVLVKLRL